MAEPKSLFPTEMHYVQLSILRLLNAKEHQICLVGIQSNPTTITSTATDTGTIGVELTPKGLYHLFHLSMHEITNRMVSFEEIFGPQGARLQQIVGDAEDPKEKIVLLQAALTHVLQKNEKEYALLDHTLDILDPNSRNDWLKN